MRLFLAAALLLTAVPALASPPDAWDELDIAAHKACEADATRFAKKARITKLAGRVLGIGAADDGDRFYGLLLAGQNGGQPVQWMCLYEKRAKTAKARLIEVP